MYLIDEPTQEQYKMITESLIEILRASKIMDSNLEGKGITGPQLLFAAESLVDCLDAQDDPEEISSQEIEDAIALHEDMKSVVEWSVPLAIRTMEDRRLLRMSAGHMDIYGTYKDGTKYVGIYQSEVDQIEFANDVLKRVKDTR